MLMPADQHWVRVQARRGGKLGIGLLAAVCLVGSAGCVSLRPEASPAADLAGHLEALSPTVASAEAALAAETACSYSVELAKEYRVVRPAILHNVLVNLGLRKRGLCFQWADDLSAKLQSLQLRTLQLHRGVARLETRREHSSVVLTAPGQPFDEGIVLDAWRHSGRLYWGGVKQDHYPWIEVEVIPDGDALSQASRKNGY
jgi:hypothetical protein